MNVELVDNITGKLCFAGMHSLARELCLLPIRTFVMPPAVLSLSFAVCRLVLVPLSGGFLWSEGKVRTPAADLRSFLLAEALSICCFLFIPGLSIWFRSICTYFLSFFTLVLRVECMTVVFTLF